MKLDIRWEAKKSLFSGWVGGWVWLVLPKTQEKLGHVGMYDGDTSAVGLIFVRIVLSNVERQHLLEGAD